MELAIGELLFKAAAPILGAAAQHGIKRLLEQSYIAKAISSTVASNSDLEGVYEALSSWCESEDFLGVVQRLKDGDRELADDDIVQSFIKTTNFFAGEATLGRARELLEHFAASIEENLLASPEGLVIHAKRTEFLHQEGRAHVQEYIDQEVISRLDAVMARLSVQSVPADTNTPPLTEEKLLHDRVDIARDLLREGKATTAASILQKLKSDPKFPSFSLDLQFRIATNLGLCAVVTDNLEQARAEFELGQRLRPENELAVVNAALGSMLSGDIEAAHHLIERALTLGEPSPRTMAIYLQILGNLGRVDELESIIGGQTSQIDNEECAQVLGHIRFDQQDFEDAERFYRKALAFNPNSPEANVGLAMSIMLPIEQVFIDNPPLAWNIPDQAVIRLKEAENALNLAIDSMRNWENRKPWRQALVDRGAVRGLMFDLDGAISDCDRVLLEDDSDSLALRNKGLTLLQKDDLRGAAECLRKIGDRKSNINIAVPLAEAYVRLGEVGEAIRLLRPLWDSGEIGKATFKVADLLLRSYRTLGQQAKVNSVLDVLTTTYGGHPDGMAAVANHHARLGQYDEAISVLERALSLSMGSQRDRIAFQLGGIHYNRNNFARVVELYRPLVDKNPDSPLLRPYLVSLVNSGAYRDALLLAREIRGEGKPLPLISEIEAQVLEYVGDLENAKELRAALAEIEPDKPSHLIRLAVIDYRMGAETEARAALSRIMPENLIGDASALVELAKARAVLGEGDYLAPAYRARKLDYGNPEVHLAYMGLFLRAEQANDTRLLPVDQVVVDSTVYLRRDSEERIFTITDEEPLNPASGDILPSSALSTQLLGRSKGDSVSLKGSPIEELTYEITEVKSKFVSAFQESISGFTTRFPEHNGLQMVDLKRNDAGILLKLVDERDHAISWVLELYRERKITLGAAANLLGLSVIDVCTHVTGRAGGQLFASTGEAETSKGELRALSDAKSVVLDVTSLLTVQHLGFKDDLRRRFDRILVPQAVMDELHQFGEEHYGGLVPSSIVGKDGGRYVRQEVTRESLESGRIFLEELRRFVLDAAELMPATSFLDIEDPEEHQFLQAIGASSAAALLVAKDKNSLLYSDDAVLRMVAQDKWQVPGAWTQSVLSNMRETGVLTENQYRSAITKLILSNYYFTSVDAEYLLWVLKQSDLSITADVARILGTLGGPDCSLDSASRVLGDLLREVWLLPVLDTQKYLILDLVLRVLTTGRPGAKAVAELKAHLRKRFALLPVHLQQILSAISLSLQTRALRYGSTL